MRLFLVVFLLSMMILPAVKAQDTLPGFSASLKPNGKVLISWRNTYPAINQISIQRSSDSLKNFTTLVSVPDPRISENGFVDSKGSGTKMFYRIFILFPNSKYLFTKSRKAKPEQIENVRLSEKTPNSNQKKTSTQIQSTEIVKKTSPPSVNQPIKVNAETAKSQSEKKSPDQTNPAEQEEEYLILPKIDNSRIFYMMEVPSLKKPTVSNTGKIRTTTVEVQKTLVVKRRDSVIMILAGKQVPQFSDSLVKQTKDTLYFVDADTLQIKPYVEIYKAPKEVYKISQYVFISKDGNVTISLADCIHKRYYVAFFENDSTSVMELKDIKDPVLIIDKANFAHAGWFRFELYEDGKLKEKNKLLIPKEF
jgi:hypothetical protein